MYNLKRGMFWIGFDAKIKYVGNFSKKWVIPQFTQKSWLVYKKTSKSIFLVKKSRKYTRKDNQLL